MKKLLLIEDSRLFAKEVSRRLAQSNQFEVHHASDLAETHELLAEHDYFAAIADLILPDAQQGEAVYPLLARGIPVITLSGSKDSTLQQQMAALPIVDYVVKEGKSDIAYAVRLAELLLITHGMPVMIVNGDVDESADIAAHIAPFGFKISQYTSGNDALQQVQPDTGLIICSHQLAQDQQGIHFVRRLRHEYDALALPVLYTLEEQGPAFDARLLKSGVNDFVVKPFSREELTSRLVTQIANRNRFRQVQDYTETLDRHVISSTTDEFGLIRQVSQAFCDISGYSREELIGRSHSIVRHPDMRNAFYREMWQTIRSGQPWQGELKNRRKDGSHYWVQTHIEPQFDAEGVISGYTAIRQDITDRKYIEQLSVTDPMTGLYNRRHFNRAFDEIARNAEARKLWLGFLIFDVDHFKTYNDNYGHQAGDDVLIRIGQVIGQQAEKHQALGYRLGGEEFALLYTSRTPDQAIQQAQELRASIEHLQIRHEYSSAADVVTASFGLYLQQQGAEVSKSYKEGDRILYRAKESGRNRVEAEISTSCQQPA